MDPDRVRAYLQVACAGLGFDIGEIWWSSNNEGASTALAAIADHSEDHDELAIPNGKKLRFVQLYTSRSYEDRRNQLVTPADEEENYKAQVNGEDDESDEGQIRKKHVLSPLLVDAISKTAQVVWAHTKKQEGLLGRSDMKLQTAVGMPVAVDGNGNMCVVVMFSPKNIQSTDDAMEYLQSISRSATSTSIPSLLPAFDPRQGLVSLPHHHETNEMIPLLSSPSLADGSVVTRFVSLDDAPIQSEHLSVPEVHSNHDLASAAKDCFGIPMLPSVSLLEGKGSTSFSNVQGEATSDAFDEASYGVWSTIMDNGNTLTDDELLVSRTQNLPMLTSPVAESNEPIYALNKPVMGKEKRDRLEEFAAAFLDVSVFDFAEVWVPISDQSDHLGQVTNVVSSDSKTNQALQEFEKMSDKILIQHWSGAVGRAFSSGNPVWSANQDVFVDSGRSSLFSQVKIETAMAVPVFSGKKTTPSFVFCCYSFVRSGSVPFVLKFVQQALRLLWDGLDKVQPHKSVGEDLWKDVAPADLGEMAADVEMQQHFMIKKRPHAAIEAPSFDGNGSASSGLGFEYIDDSADKTAVRSIYTGAGDGQSPPMSPVETPTSEFEPTIVPVKYQPYESIQSHIQQAVQSVGTMETMHHHVATNAQGSKRAHVFVERLDSPVDFDVNGSEFASSQDNQFMQSSAPPLAMPRPLPLPNGLFMQPTKHNGFNQNSQQIQPGHAPADSMAYQNAPQDQSQSMGYFSQPQHVQPQSMTGYGQQQQSSTMQQQQQVFQPAVPQHQQQVSQGHDNSSYTNYMQQSQALNKQQFEVGYGQQIQPLAPSNDLGLGPSLQTTETLALPQQINQTNYGNVQPTSTPGMAMNSVAPVPVDKLSASGITFPVPQHAIQPSQMVADMRTAAAPAAVANGGVQVAPLQVTMPQNGVGGATYCLPAAQGNASQKKASSKPCRIQGCDEPAVARRPYCVKHSGNRMCEHPGCSKCAQGSTRFCIAHGGGRRCTFPGCDKGARDKFFCAAHGGGKRCTFDGCNKSAVGGSNLCTAHGGGRRCSVQGCDKSAQSSTKFCVKHGGGKKCTFAGCEKVARGKTNFCAAHGGGVRCKLAGCNRVAIGKHQLCRSHGGGTRSRAPKGRAPQPPTMPNGNAGAGGIPAFADMTSV